MRKNEDAAIDNFLRPDPQRMNNRFWLFAIFPQAHSLPFGWDESVY
jgi:hypothetical protein